MTNEELIQEAVNVFLNNERKLAKLLAGSFSTDDTSQNEVDDLIKVLDESRKTILRLFNDETLIELKDKTTIAAIKKVRNGKDLFQVITSALPDLRNDNVEAYFGDDWLIKLNNEYDLENIFLRRMEAGAIVLKKMPPRNITGLFGKLRQCYECGSYEAAIVFCRAAIEQGLKENIIAKEMLKEAKQSDSLFYRINCSPLKDDLKERAHVVRESANSIIHDAVIEEYPKNVINISYSTGDGNMSSFSVTKNLNEPLKERALECIRDTLQILETLC